MGIITHSFIVYIMANEMVKWYFECACGAITIFFDNGTSQAVTKNYIKDNGIDLTKAVRLSYSYHCENCYPMEKVCKHVMK